MLNTIVKRDGKEVPFEKQKINDAVAKALRHTGERDEALIDQQADVIASAVVIDLERGNEKPKVETVQDLVEEALMQQGLHKTARAYIIYREEHTKERLKNERELKAIKGNFDDVTNNGEKSEANKGPKGNANVDVKTVMGKMLYYGTGTSTVIAMGNIIPEVYAKAHENRDIHIHDADFYATKSTTCAQIDLQKLFENGFSTGHGYQRPPQSIMSYQALAAIVLQSNQNEQHGGQSIPAFDFYMAPGVLKTFRKEMAEYLGNGIEDLYGLAEEESKAKSKRIAARFDTIEISEEDLENIADELQEDLKIGHKVFPGFVSDMVKRSYARAYKKTNRQTYQAMEAFIHNLNTMHSRAGAQVPFTSVNYGTDTSPEGRMVIRNLLLATESGLGNGETPIFPIQIFKLKEGVSYNDGDPNSDLFDLACRVSAKRLFPNFSFLDSPFNLQYYKPGHPETEATYMGCRTRVVGNVCGEETVTGRGNLSFTTINMPRLAIKAKLAYPDDEEKRIAYFYERLDEMMELVRNQLLERMRFQRTATVQNFPFLMGQGVWRGSDELSPTDTIGDLLKQGTLSIGFIGLAETLTALTGKHHGESDESQKLGLEIIGHMRKYCDDQSQQMGLNFTLLATPAEGLSGRFVKADREKYGLIEGVTDKKWNTNSFHIPVGYNITAAEKIKREAPYHALTNAGHISYIELDGDTAKNVEAFKSIVKFEKECGMGYASINHPVDRDPVCGYVGVIDNSCPCCGREEHKDAGSIRIPRIR